jgi:type II secretory pathway pseudopilin PulG
MRTKIEKIIMTSVALIAVIIMITFNTSQLAVAQQLTLSFNGQPAQTTIQGQGLGNMYTPCPPINPGTPLRALLEFNVHGTNNGTLIGTFNTTNPLYERPSHGIITNGMVTSSGGVNSLFILYGTSEVPICTFSPDVTIIGYCGMNVPIWLFAGNGRVVTFVQGDVSCTTTT